MVRRPPTYSVIGEVLGESGEPERGEFESPDVSGRHRFKALSCIPLDKASHAIPAPPACNCALEHSRCDQEIAAVKVSSINPLEQPLAVC